MIEKLADIKDKAVDRIKNIGLIRGLEIGSGIAFLLGAVFVNFLADDELAATDILENYESTINVDDVTVEDVVDDTDDDE